ncbi:uncharacterized protein C8Q71DRAFT_727157 [Rhodofomes roseus]|uniref:DUF5648 domain-containing protein n=1 Tax=Rhodofomes roseus TaxID=34475 RepID=A0ABQ8K358_9APHY|nr:uncharacterized protein C8Q71DRAFT_727157 [Rhodofomes roseus]KAH9830968.1 hypothetical protein C8Q71DRAFT_727157 [Rhodofomes roseus]
MPFKSLICAITLAFTAMTAAVCDIEHAAPFWGASSSRTDHFYSTNYAQINNSRADGYEVQGRLGFIYRDPVVDSTIFFRLYNPTNYDHFYTVNSTRADEVIENQGYIDRGYVGYVYTTDICGSVPLYQLYKASATDHYYTANKTEADNAVSNDGYVLQGTAAYILPNL